MNKLPILLFLALLAPCSGRAGTILFQNAIVHTISGETITNGSVLINGDKIESVGEGKSAAKVTADQTIDLQGRHLYPGLIALDSAMGLSEIEAIRSTQDTTEVGEYTPDVQSWIAVNPDSELLPVARANGITHFEPVPQGGVVAGFSGVLAMDGWTTEQMTIRKPAALHVYWPNMSLDTTPREKFHDKSKFKSLEDQSRERQAKLKALDDFFLEARAYALARAAKISGTNKAATLNPPWEAMLPVVHGEIPLMVHADDRRQILAAAQWAKTNDYKIIIVGGRDAAQAAVVLAAQKIPVIFEATFHLPNRDFDSYDVYFKTPEVLHHAGVKVAFSLGSSSFQAPLAKNLPHLAAQSTAFGLPENETLKGLTLYPAQLLGVDKRLGSIEPGKEATLFVCDGSILDIRASVQRLWIAGREISLENRHTRLYDKYKKRPLPK